MRDGFLNILKPPGMSSHDIVGEVRRALGVKKVGHAGTLDPGAAGVLPIAVGRATRLIEYLGDVDKSYRAEMELGYATDSCDDLGNVLVKQDFLMPSLAEVKEAAAAFKGKIKQVPPIYSAIKINGRRACDLARQQQSPEIPEREIEIFSLDILAVSGPHILFDVCCSKGTYVRSLCRDLGEKLSIPAVMTFLVRTRVGDFSLSEAVTIEELKAGSAVPVPPEKYLTHLKSYELPPARIKAFRNGLSTGIREEFADGTRLLVFSGVEFIGVGRYTGKTKEILPEKVYSYGENR